MARWHLSMLHMERHSRNTLVIIIFIISNSILMDSITLHHLYSQTQNMVTAMVVRTGVVADVVVATAAAVDVVVGWMYWWWW